MKVDRKVQKVGIISCVILAGLVVLGKFFNVPVLSTAVNDVLYPFEKGIQIIGDGAGNVFARFQNVNKLIAENEKLKKQIDELEYENTLLPQYKDKIEDLTGLLEMKNRFVSYNGTGANIIARDYGNWNKIYTIDKGTRNDVNSDCVVLADGGLAGYVSESSYTTSKVVSIIDSRSSVGAQVVRTGEIGIVKGDVELANEGLCLLEINGESEIMKGDQIITSYLSNIYPPGILIGTVDRVLESNNNLVSYAYVKPVVDFEHLSNVLIIDNNNNNE